MTSANMWSTGNLSTPGFPGGGAGSTDSGNLEYANGADGAVRIIWGKDRFYPNFNTQDM